MTRPRSQLTNCLTSTVAWLIELDGDIKTSSAALLCSGLRSIDDVGETDIDATVLLRIERENFERRRRQWAHLTSGFIWLVLICLQNLRRYDDMHSTDYARQARELILEVGVAAISANGQKVERTKLALESFYCALLTASRDSSANARTLAEGLADQKIWVPGQGQPGAGEASQEGGQSVAAQAAVTAAGEPLGAPSTGNSRSLDEILAELRGLIGLNAVKREVEQLMAFLVVQQRRRSRGLAPVPLSLHLVFYGNPGTGKTTVARLIAECYRALGVLRNGHLIETDRSGLVGGYLGQTALKVKEVVNDALGGVLFIDEAYALAPAERDDPFGSEAIATLLKAMEDHREELAVIVAGYPKKMQVFLDSNPGMRSRFSKYFTFEDYTPEQLSSVFVHFCAGNGYVLADGARAKLVGILTRAYERRDETFGNARFARNIFEAALQRQATRIVGRVESSSELLSTLETEDLAEDANELL